MTVPTKDEIDVMVLFELFKDVGGMSQEEGIAVFGTSRKAIQIGSVERRIVDARDRQLPITGRNEYGLIDQECNFVPVGEFREVIDGHTAVMVMVPQGHEHRRDRAQLSEETKEVRQSFRHIEKIACDENPMGVELLDHRDNHVVARKILVEMQVAQMHGSAPCQGSVLVTESGDVVVG
jgi:hypothetical protein